jgi:hypothetical protein
MKMKTMLLVACLWIASAFTPAVFGQTTTVQTALSAAITTSNTNTITVVSATGLVASTASAQTFLYVDAELMQLRTISGTTLTVTRGSAGTVASPHQLGSLVMHGPPGTFSPTTGFASGVFLQADPKGSCTAASNQYTLVANAQTATIWRCLNGNWSGIITNNRIAVFPYTPVVNAAYTATLVDTFIEYISVTATRILTLPSISGTPGKILIVKNSTAAAAAAPVTVTGANGQFVGTLGTATYSLEAGLGPVRLISSSYTPYTSPGVAGTTVWGWTTF